MSTVILQLVGQNDATRATAVSEFRQLYPGALVLTTTSDGAGLVSGLRRLSRGMRDGEVLVIVGGVAPNAMTSDQLTACRALLSDIVARVIVAAAPDLDLAALRAGRTSSVFPWNDAAFAPRATSISWGAPEAEFRSPSDLGL